MQNPTPQNKRKQTVDLSETSASGQIKRKPTKKIRRSAPKTAPSTSQVTQKKKRTALKVTVVILLVLIVGAGVLAGISISPAQAAYENALKGKSNLEKAQAAILEQNFEDAKMYTMEAKINFETTETEMRKLSWVKAVPYAGRQYSAADHLVKGGLQLLSALETGFSVADSILEPISKTGEDASFKDFGIEQKGEILQQLQQNAPELERALSQVELAELEFQKIPDDGLVPQLSEAKALVADRLPEGMEILEEVVVAARLFPILAGYPEEQSYMLLFQNNTELRPSGGFLGSYGELTLKNAEIQKFTTHDVYGLDSASDISVEPPWQIKKLVAPYNKSWYMRDSNWSPDFPSASENVLYFYDIEGGLEDFDGVIGITPDFISFLLEIAGPTEIAGQPYVFTSENLTETLQFHVEKNFVNKGIDFHERKDIISDLSGVLIGKILALPQSEWPRIYDVVQQALMEKHMVVYMKNKDAQDFLESKNWAGEINDTEGDFILPVDANMASLKTDEYIERAFEYTLDATKSEPKAELKLSYKNNAPGLTWKTTRYRNWNRIYVPGGSQFEQVIGSEDGDFYNDPNTKYEIAEEKGKANYGTFISVEPGDQESLTYTYTLPKEVIGDDMYTLYFQKQIGTISPKVRVRLSFDREIDAVFPSADAQKISATEVEFNSDLLSDKEFKVKFK